MKLRLIKHIVKLKTRALTESKIYLVNFGEKCKHYRQNVFFIFMLNVQENFKLFE